MVSGVSVAGAVNAAYAQFDRAAGAVVADTSSDPSNTGDIGADIVQMDSSKIAVAAALWVMKKSTDILAESLNIGGYGVKVDA